MPMALGLHRDAPSKDYYLLNGQVAPAIILRVGERRRLTLVNTHHAAHHCEHAHDSQSSSGSNSESHTTAELTLVSIVAHTQDTIVNTTLKVNTAPSSFLELRVPGCDMHVIAHDGVYRSFSLSVPLLPIAPPPFPPSPPSNPSF
jgi:hypothetical protein